MTPVDSGDNPEGLATFDPTSSPAYLTTAREVSDRGRRARGLAPVEWSLLDAIEEARDRLATMGEEAIAEAHAAGSPAWVEGDDGRIQRLDPDGTRHVETRSAGEVLAAARAAMPRK